MLQRLLPEDFGKNAGVRIVCVNFIQTTDVVGGILALSFHPS